MSEQAKKKKKKGLNSYLILAACLVGTAVLTWIVSAFSPEVTPATLAQVLSSPVEGFASALAVCVFVIVLGGFREIVAATGALDAGIAALVRRMRGHELLLIPILMTLLGICGSTYGMCEETVPFYIIIGTAMYAAGFDTLTSCLMVLLGAGCGCIGSTVNPFSVGVAQAALADLGYSVDQGVLLALGLVILVIAEGSAIVFVMNYARKVRANPDASLMSPSERAAEKAEFSGASDTQERKLTGRQRLVLVLLAFAFIVMIISFIPWENFGITVFLAGATGDNLATAWSAILTGVPLGQWYFNECTTWFLLMAIVVGIAGGLSGDSIVKTFLKGAAGILDIALVIALARAISVLMSATHLDTWLLNTAASMLANVPAPVFAIGSMVVFLLLSFAIPSSSGMATVSMPIMGPLAIQLGLSPEVMIMIYVVAHGLILLFTPTFGVLVAGLAISKVEYNTFLKCLAPYLVGLTVVLMALLTVAMVVL